MLDTVNALECLPGRQATQYLSGVIGDLVVVESECDYADQYIILHFIVHF